MSNTRELSQLASVISVADETRNIGIGTTNPTSKLHVSGDVIVTGVVTATSFSGDGSALTGISGGSSSSQFVTTAAGIHTLSNVGIGTTTPTSRLHVSGDVIVTGIVTATTFVGALTGTASNVTTNANLTGHVTSVGNAAVLGSFTSLQLLTALTDETGSGANVFATSPTLVTPVLGTPSSGTLTSCTGLPLTTGVTGTLPVANGGTGVTSSTGTGSVVLSASPTFTGTVGAAAITATGDIAAANFNSTSDISLKDNIQTIVNPLDKIIKLNGVTFNWKENQKPSIGVIAQELEKVLPELVTQGNIKTVNYNGIIGVLIEAIKELKKEVEDLKSYK